MCVYLRTKFQESSIIVTGFINGGGGRVKSPPILGLNYLLLKLLTTNVPIIQKPVP